MRTTLATSARLFYICPQAIETSTADLRFCGWPEFAALIQLILGFEVRCWILQKSASNAHTLAIQDEV